MTFATTNSLFEQTRNKTGIALLGTFTFTILTGLSTFIVIPLGFTPIPITAQTLVVLLSGIFLGRHYGALSQLLYVAIGVIGIPWFANRQSGLEVLLGATGGHLIGFILASYVVGSLIDSNHFQRKPVMVIYALALSTLCVYIFGVLGLILVANVGLLNALNLGFFPFLPGDLFKLLLATLIAKFYLPQYTTKTDVRTSLQSRLPIIILSIGASITTLFFLFYLLQAGNILPANLMVYSLISGLIIVPAVYQNYNELRDFRNDR